MTSNYSPVQNAYTRAFLMDGRASPWVAPTYASFLKLTGFTKSFGDLTRVEMPDPNEYGKFQEVATIRGASERATASLVGRYPSKIKSILMRMATTSCPIDVQLHIGQCTDPSDFGRFEKALVLENVTFTEYSTEDLGALSSDEQGKVDETVGISIESFYEVLPMTFSSKAGNIITNELVDIVVSDSVSCGSCGQTSNGCNRIYAVSLQAGGSPSTPADVVFSDDGGVSWYAVDVDGMGTEVPTGIAVVGDYVVVVSATVSSSIYYALKDDFRLNVDPAFSKISTGLVAGGLPNDIWAVGRIAFLVGGNGYIYLMENPSNGVTVLDAGSATSSQLNAVHALSETVAVAVGNAGAVVYTVNQTGWQATLTKPVAAGVNLNTVWMRTATEWWVGAANGTVYYTRDSGNTWKQVVMPGTSPSAIEAICFSTRSVGFISGTVSSHGKIFRTYDGGYSWKVAPEATGAIPASDRFNAIAVCQYDANFMAAAGLADDAADGVLIVGGAT